MKKLIALILVFAMTLSLVPAAFAAERDFGREEELAGRLKELGLFRGVSETDFALEKAPTRTEALVMLIRLLGKEDEALASDFAHPFDDVPEWADKYVGYAYEQKLTNGISAIKFGSENAASAEMYLTFVLRALGYSDGAEKDFEWDKPYYLANESGLLRGNPDCDNFLRADVVLISYAALGSRLKDDEMTLGTSLIGAEVYTADAFEKNFDLTLLDSSEEEETHAEDENAPAEDENNSAQTTGSTFDELAKFILENDSGAMNSYPSVMLYLEETNETLITSYVQSGHMIASTYQLTTENAHHIVSVVYNEDDSEVAVTYGYVNSSDGEIYIEAASMINKADVKDGIKIVPDKIEVVPGVSATEEEIKAMASEVMSYGTIASLVFTGAIINNYLDADMSIADFGFTGIKSE